MGKTRGTSDGATTLLQNNDVVARIIAYGGDGNDTTSSLGAIQFDVDGTPGNNDMPGRIIFSTTPDGSATYQERLRIGQDGTCTFANNVTVNGYLEVANDNIYMQRSLTHSGDTNTKIEFPSDDNVAIVTAGTTRLNIDGNGESIFTNDLAAGGTHPFSVTGGDFRNISVSGTTAASSGFLNLGNGAAATNNGFDLGRINIHNGATLVAQIAGRTSSGANDDGDITFSTKATTTALSQKMVILDSGNVGIGVDTPFYPLEVKAASNAYITTQRTTKAGGQVGIQIRGGTGSSKDWYLYQHTDENILRLYNTSDSNLIEYTETGMNFSQAGLGIGFHPNGSNEVNLLDDYEEGTWTPNTSEGMGTVTHASYRKIGAVVHVNFYINAPTSSSGGDFLISNLPFTLLGGSHYAIGSCYTQMTAGTYVFLQANQNGTTMNVLKNVGNGISYSTLSGGYILGSITYFTAT
jgi:hypothetical protein